MAGLTKANMLNHAASAVNIGPANNEIQHELSVSNPLKIFNLGLVQKFGAKISAMESRASLVEESIVNKTSERLERIMQDGLHKLEKRVVASEAVLKHLEQKVNE